MYTNVDGITEHLQKRGYSRNTVENQLSKVDSLDRTSLLKYNTRKQNTDRVPLVVTYSNGLPNIHNILSKNLKILHQSERMKEVFKNVPLVSYKRDKNIKDILVHRKHNLQFYNKDNGCMKCGKHCALCNHNIETKTFKDNSGNILIYKDTLIAKLQV